MNQLPIFLNIQDKRCLIIGGGEVASQNVSILLKAGARVTVLAPELCDALSERREEGEITWVKKEFDPLYLDNISMVIAATNDKSVNMAVSRVARERGIPVKVMDQPDLCTFTMPSIEEVGLSVSQQSQEQVTANISIGEVYLVGGGPGDPDLLTLRALKLMQKADIVLYDNLVSDEVMGLVRQDVERIYVGKKRGNHALSQEEINKLLVRLAQEGKRVLRIKGGDPFIFGRGGEEIETLADYGIPFQVVPGISAANGVASYAGIPLTHRDYAQAVTFVTGHLKDGTVNLDWPSLARPHQTVVIYMGLGGLAEICLKLMEHGLPPEHPIAVIQQGTTQNQRVMTGILADLPARVETAGFKAPTLTIVGDVVKLRGRLSWFEPAQ